MRILVNSEDLSEFAQGRVRRNQVAESGNLWDLHPPWVSVSLLRTYWLAPQLDFSGGEGKVERETSQQLSEDYRTELYPGKCASPGLNLI